MKRISRTSRAFTSHLGVTHTWLFFHRSYLRRGRRRDHSGGGDRRWRSIQTISLLLALKMRLLWVSAAQVRLSTKRGALHSALRFMDYMSSPIADGRGSVGPCYAKLWQGRNTWR